VLPHVLAKSDCESSAEISKIDSKEDDEAVISLTWKNTMVLNSNRRWDDSKICKLEDQVISVLSRRLY
jgi:hypothetical protein